jgi:multiple sugar transport system substrate-binding protein
MTSPEVSREIVSMARGYDPYRRSHFENTQWAAEWFPGALEFLAGLKANMEYGVYDLYIPGAQQYLDAVGKHLGDILTGVVSLDEGLRRIADEWNEITNRWGRESQKAFYQDYLRTYWGWKG